VNLHNRDDFLSFTALFLMALLMVTMLLSWFSDINPMEAIHFHARDLAVGCLAAIGMVVVFSFVSSTRNEAEQAIGPALQECEWYDLAIMAILVGVIEELLFRGVLEPWIGIWHPGFAFVVVNVFFGFLHAVSRTYFVVATLLGMFLSVLVYWPGDDNLLRPIVAHAVYDYIGFMWIKSSFAYKTDHEIDVDQINRIHEEMQDDD